MSDSGGALPVQRKRVRSTKALVAFIVGIVGVNLWLFGAVPATIFALSAWQGIGLGMAIWVCVAGPTLALALWAKVDLWRHDYLTGRGFANAALALGLIELVAPPLLVCAVTMHGPVLKKECVAHFHLSGTLNESPDADPMGTLVGQPSTLYSLLKRIHDAKEDPAVKAVAITAQGLQLRLSQAEELRTAIVDFLSSEKKLFAYCEDDLVSFPVLLALGQASRFSVPPPAWISAKGLYSEHMYLKDAFDMLGVQSDVIQMGDFKSAGETFARSGPSDAAKENQNWLSDGLYESCVAMLAEARHKTPEEAKALIDKGFYSTAPALQAGLIDAAEHRAGFMEQLKRACGENVLIDNYYRHVRPPDVSSERPIRSFLHVLAYFARLRRIEPREAIGLIYADGLIVTGYGPPGQAFSGNMRVALKELDEDDAVKAVVMRVNSPGGSVTASDIIREAVQSLQSKKPLIVSMGGVAASGGYYISCGAKSVFADETTITGSIGVISDQLTCEGLWKKLGVNWYPVQRGANADMFTGAHPFTEAQRAALTADLQDVYGNFKHLVETGRNGKLAKPTEELASGRVFTGKQALELGLVDQIGGLQAAIAFAAKSAGLDQYRVRVAPAPKDLATLAAEVIWGEPDKSDWDLHMDKRKALSGLQAIAGASTEAPALAALVSALDKPHADAALEMLSRVQLLREEGKALVMPQTFVFP